MSLEELKRKCPKCGHEFIPRKTSSQRCPECNTLLPSLKKRFLTKKELEYTWRLHGASAIMMFVLGWIFAFMWHDVIGIVTGLIGMLFFLTLGQRYYVELRIYDLLHKPTEPKE